MKRGVWLPVLLALAACHRHEPAPVDAAPSASAASVAVADASAELPPLELGPAPANQPGPAREQAVFSLLSGNGASRLPVVATDPGEMLDLTLRDVVAPTVRPGQVQIGKLDVVGVLAPEVVMRIVRQRMPDLVGCYQRGLANNPNLQGRVLAKLVIGADGKVSAVSDGGSDLPDQGVVQCLLRTLNRAEFPKPEQGIVAVQCPFVLTPAS